METSKKLTSNALEIIKNVAKESSFNIYLTVQPGGSLQDSLWSLYLDNQQKYQDKN